LVGKQSCRAGHSDIALSGDGGGNGTFVSRVPHGAGKYKANGGIDLKSLRPAPPKSINLDIKNFFRPRSDIRHLLFILSFVLILVPSLASAAQVSLSWQRSTGSNIAGYKMNYGNYRGRYQYTVNVGNSTSCTISGLTEGNTYYFAATAYNTNQEESDYSNEVSYRIPSTNNSIFADVPPGHRAEVAIYAIYDAEITTGCSQNPMRYCPEDEVTRAQMAIFLGRAEYGGRFTPPSATGIFADVPARYAAADWIEQLYDDGITTGCGQNPLRYCPADPVTRTQMAIFLLRRKHGSTYTPPPATGIFADVPVTHQAADWIEQIYREGITTGCHRNPLRYCPASTVTRAQMARFLMRTFGL